MKSKRNISALIIVFILVCFWFLIGYIQGKKRKSLGYKLFKENRNQNEFIFLRNNSSSVCGFKPDDKIEGTNYEGDGAYYIQPSETINFPIDGVKTPLRPCKIFKVPDGALVEIQANGDVTFDFFGLSLLCKMFGYGWRTCPDKTWLNLFSLKL